MCHAPRCDTRLSTAVGAEPQHLQALQLQTNGFQLQTNGALARMHRGHHACARDPAVRASQTALACHCPLCISTATADTQPSPKKNLCALGLRRSHTRLLGKESPPLEDAAVNLGQAFEQVQGFVQGLGLSFRVRV